MITENSVLFEINLDVGEILYNTQQPAYYLEIINRKTLYTWSEYFPKIIKGINIRQSDGIPVKHPQTGVVCSSSMYKIPKNNIADEYIGYEQVFYPGNIALNQGSSNLPAMNGMMNMVSQFLPNSQYYGKVRFSFDFKPPDILVIDPTPATHIDFSLNMQRKCRLHEVPMYYREDFLKLCVCDVKMALYSKFKHLKDGQTYQGLEIKTELINELADAKDERKDLIEKFEKNYFKDPSRYGALMEYSEFT